MKAPHPIQYARVNWQNEQPSSDIFDDIYFSREDGLAETEYVFIKGNRLQEDWSKQPPYTSRVIGETGFGTGLNFLAARALWLAQTESGCLEFVSCEKYPLHPKDLRRALEPFSTVPNFTAGISQLLQQWPEPVYGFHSLTFDQGRVKLTLLFGDASEQLSELDAKIDYWFLDGFAPAKNQEMWNTALFEQIARLSKSGTRAATFTCAGLVKQGLKRAGFEIKKIPGFGRKREMLTAECVQSTYSVYRAPWLKRPPIRPISKIAVIGAGIAGTTTALSLAEQGFPVDLYERAPVPAQGGSGNPQGALYIKLPQKPTAQSRFHLTALMHSIRYLHRLGLNDAQHSDLCGLLQLAMDDRDLERMQGLIASKVLPESLVQSVDAEQASALVGSLIKRSGLYFPGSGWASPPKLCNRLMQHRLIKPRLNQEALEIAFEAHHWRVNQNLGYSHLVLCTAWETELVSAFHPLKLKPIRGQTSWVKQPTQSQLKRVVCGSGYISPPLDGTYCFGSSFGPGDTSSEIREEEHRHNLQLLTQALPEFAIAMEQHRFKGRVAHRAGSPDYLPLVGPLSHIDELQKRYAPLRSNAKAVFDEQAPWMPGLFVNLGHGSKGLVTSPLCAEIITAQISGAPLPVEQSLVDLLCPSRFAIKALKQAKL